MRIVLCNGVWDLVHRGHIEHLREARKMGDILIVSVTMDSSVNKGPGRPINTLADRMLVLKELRSVSVVVPTPNAVTAIRKLKPAIFCKGIDYAGGERFTEVVIEACAEVGAEIRYTSTPKISATELIERAKKAGTMYPVKSTMAD